MLAPPLGAYLMRSSLWVPIIIGFVCLLLAVALTVVIPETRFSALATGEPREDGLACNPAGSSESEERKVDFGLKGRIEAAVRHTVSTVGFVLKHRNLVLLMAVFFSTDFAQQSPTILLRYVSSRYSVSLAKVCTHISKKKKKVYSMCMDEPKLLRSRCLLKGRSISRPATCSPSRRLDKCWHMASSFLSSTPHWSADLDSCLALRIFTSPK